MSKPLTSVKVSTFWVLRFLTVPEMICSILQLHEAKKVDSAVLYYFWLWFLSLPSNWMTYYLRCLYMIRVVFMYMCVHKYYFVIFLKIIPGTLGLLFCASNVGWASQYLCSSGELTQWLWNKRWQKPDNCNMVHKLHSTQFALHFLTSI